MLEKGKTSPARPPDVSTIPIGAAYLVLASRRISTAYGGLIDITRVAPGWPRKRLCFGPAPSAPALHVLCRITPRVALTPYAFQIIKFLCWANSTNVGPCQTSFNLKRIIKGVPIKTPIVLGALNYGT